MQRFYITFPYKNTQLRNKYTIVHAVDEETARLLAIETYGRNWAFLYDEQGFKEQPKKYNLTMHEELKL